MTYSSNLFHVTGRIIFFSSLSPTWKVVPLRFTWMTQPSPQNLPFPIFLTVPYLRQHNFHFIFLKCRFFALYADATALLTQIVASWYYLPQTQSCCNGLAQILHDMENPIKYPQNLNPSIFQASPPPLSRPLFKSMVPLCPGRWQYAI